MLEQVAAIAAPETIVVRPYSPADYDGVIAVFADIYAGIDDNFASFEDMEALRVHFPDGQIVACIGDEVVGLILSLHCRYAEFSQPKAMADIYNPTLFASYSEDGDSLFALEILVKSSHRRKGIGKLLNNRIVEVLQAHQLRAFIGVSRLSGYGAVQSEMSVDEYIAKVVSGELFDPSLSFNCANQMLPTKAVPQYYPADTASAGYGAIVVQANPQYAPPFAARLDAMLAGEFDLLRFPDAMLLPEAERESVLGQLQALPFTFTYEGMPPCWGKAFENYLSMTEYLAPHPLDAAIADLCAPINARIVQLLKDRGWQVEVLQDPQYGQPYTVGDFRVSPIAAGCTMLHVDELTQDAVLKPDFQLPEPLRGQPYHQLMVLLPLACTGEAKLRSYDRRYHPADEVHRMENGWQFADAAVAGAGYLERQPLAGEALLMANQYFHDLVGGERDSEWIYYSLYILTVPSLGKAFLYI